MQALKIKGTTVTGAEFNEVIEIPEGITKIENMHFPTVKPLQE